MSSEVMWRLLVTCALVLVVDCTGGNEELKLRSLLSSRAGDPMVRPTASVTDNITVTAALTLIDVEVDEQNDVVTINGWLSIDWYNWRLSWDDAPALAIVKHTRMSLASMWSPDLLPYNQLPSARADWLLPMLALVETDGKVLVAPPVTFAVRCRRRSFADGEARLTCPIRLGSWTYSEKELDLQPGSDVVDVSNFNGYGGWVVESSSVKRVAKTYPCCSGKYVTLDMELVLKSVLKSG